MLLPGGSGSGHQEVLLGVFRGLRPGGTGGCAGGGGGGQGPFEINGFVGLTGRGVVAVHHLGDADGLVGAFEVHDGIDGGLDSALDFFGRGQARGEPDS
jgi:hypothetical protein